MDENLVELVAGIAIDDTEELEKRATQAREGAAGIPWDQVKRDLRPGSPRTGESRR